MKVLSCGVFRLYLTSAIFPVATRSSAMRHDK